MRHQGTVKWFRGSYGFIVPADAGKDLFVHHSGIDMQGYRTLDAGAEVEYEVAPGTKGPMAVSVRVLAPAAG